MISIIQKSHLYTIFVIFICINMVWMVQCYEQENQETEMNPPQEQIHIPSITSEIPTVGTSGMWIHMILDESGSMDSVRDSTIHAINQYINKQKSETSTRTSADTSTDTSADTSTSTNTNQVHVSLMKFEGGRTPIVYDRIPLHQVPALDHSCYQPAGGTNLYDAIGHTIQRIDQQLLQSSSIYERPAVLVVILTDGEENQSEYFTRGMIQTMIQQRREAGWKFIFLGANIDAGSVAEEIGIDRNAAIKIDVADTSYSEALDQSTRSWRKSAEKVQLYASAQPASSMSAEIFAHMMDSEVDADFSDQVREQYERP